MQKVILSLAFSVSLSNVAHSAQSDSPFGETFESHTKYTLTVPTITESNIGRKTHCIRPRYEGSLDLGIEQIGDKTLVTISGFGGSGITIGEGAVAYMVDKWISKFRDSYDGRPIDVIGGGWVGSLTVLYLISNGYKVNVYADKWNGGTTTSHNAGGLIAPVSMNNSKEAAELANKLGADAYKAFEKALRGEHPFLSPGEDGRNIVKVPAFFDNILDSGLGDYVTQGVMEQPKNAVVDMYNPDKDTSVTHENMICFEDCMFANPYILTEDLHCQMEKHPSISLHIGETVSDLQKLPSSHIFNCAGLRAGEFKERTDVGLDYKMLYHCGQSESTLYQFSNENYNPTLGHLFYLKGLDHPTSGLGLHNTMFLQYLGESALGDNRLPCEDSLYAFPKVVEEYDVVIGGTFIQRVETDSVGNLLAKHRFDEKFDLIEANLLKFVGQA